MRLIVLFLFLITSSNVFAVNLSRLFFENSDLAEVSNSVSNKFEVTEGNPQVVFSADFDNDNFFELYAINVDGSFPRRLDVSGYNSQQSPLPLSFKIEDANDFEVAPDGSYVLFEAENPDGSGEELLYGVNLLVDSPIAFPIVPPANLSEGLNYNGRFKISNDSKMIVFAMSGSIINESQILIGAHRFFKLNVGINAFSQGGLQSLPSSFYTHFGLASELVGAITENNLHYVVAHPVLPFSATPAVFSVSINGGNAVQISNGYSGDNGSMLVGVSPDSSSILFNNLSDSSGDGTDLFVSNIDGSSVAKLTSLSPNEVVTGFVSPNTPSFSTNSGSILYHIDVTDNVNQGNPFLRKAKKVVVANPIKAQSGATLQQYEVENALVFDHGIFTEAGDLFHLVSGGSNVSLYNGRNSVAFLPNEPSFAYVKKHIHSRDGKVSVIVAGNQSIGGIDQAYVYDKRTLPATFTQITDIDSENRFLLGSGIALSPNSETVLLSIPDESASNIFSGVIKSIFAVNVGDEDPVNITPNIVEDGHILSIKYTPDSKTIVYTADRDQDELVELYSLNIEDALKEKPSSTSGDDMCFPIKSKTSGLAVICL